MVQSRLSRREGRRIVSDGDAVVFIVDIADLTSAVKSLAREAGFARVGIAPAGEVSHAQGLHDWLRRHWHGRMTYMEENLPKRLRPDLLVEGTRSVICLAVGYAPAEEGAQPALVARYARGRDYHKVLKKRCHVLMDRIRQVEGGFDGRAFVDSAPLMERSLAASAGLGWIGRNGCLYVPGLGSYVLLCEIVCNLPLAADSPMESRCDRCDACVRACPMEAIGDESLLDARRCISYLTVEHRGEIAPDLAARMGGGLFGCDRCQEVCPHNRDLPAGDAELTAGPPPLNGAGIEQVLQWRLEDWDQATRGSPCRRATHPMFLRNARIAQENLRLTPVRRRPM